MIAILLATTGCVQTSNSTNTSATPEVQKIIDELQKGGHVVYFRHAQTEKDYADQINAQMGNCSTQRTLSENGWNQAKTIGTAFTEFNIPVDEVISSEYCRAWQTAEIAFGRHKKNKALNFFPAEEYTDEQIAEMRNAVMPLLIKTPPTGKNTVIVGHDDVFESATGIYPEPQGVAYILKPNGKKFEIVGHLRAEEWK